MAAGPLCKVRPAQTRRENKLQTAVFVSTGGDGDGTGAVSSVFLLQVLRQTQLRGKSEPVSGSLSGR